MNDVLNRQLNREYFSALFYLSMAAKADELGYKGVARWFKVQYHEEKFHAMKFFEYIQQRGGTIEFMDIEKPEQDFNTVKEIYTRTLEHEQDVTAMINNLMDVAIEEKDHAAQIYLQWFITEQVEEEENVNDILTRIGLIGDDKQGMLMLDSELGTRALNIPTDFTNGLPKN